MAIPLDDTIGATAKDLTGALDSLQRTRELALEGDVDAALIEAHMGVLVRIDDARRELGGVIDALRERGGVYPPPDRPTPLSPPPS